jgi:hypothetical protein
MKAQPIWASYNETGALAIACPHRGAEPGKWCTRADGRLGSVPCVTRVASTSGATDDRPRDFSEPMHGGDR